MIYPIIFFAVLTGAFFARKIPAISIPLGLLFMAPFTLAAAETYLSSRDNSVGAAFIPIILMALFILAIYGAFLFIIGMQKLKSGLRITLMWLIPSTLGLAGGVVVYSWSQENINHVIASAETIAGNTPYCIQVASANDDKEATFRSDYSGYHMRTQGGPHALLAIGNGNQPEIYHWSYHNKSFIKDSAQYAIYCKPRAHFAITMLDKPVSEQPSKHFRYAGMTLSIPQKYKSKVIGFNYPAITFYSTAPAFENVPDAKDSGAINSHIEVNFIDTNRTDYWLTKDDSSHIVETSGEEYGLKKNTLWYVGSGPREKLRPRYFQYFNVSNDNRVVTVINCSDIVKGQCLHAFRHDGWTYTFHHSPVDLPEWKSMQDKLVKLTHSFIETPQ